MRKLKEWWAKLSSNEKMMYPLIAVLIIAIATRWRYVLKELGEAFSGMVQ